MANYFSSVKLKVKRMNARKRKIFLVLIQVLLLAGCKPPIPTEPNKNIYYTKSISYDDFIYGRYSGIRLYSITDNIMSNAICLDSISYIQIDRVTNYYELKFVGSQKYNNGKLLLQQSGYIKISDVVLTESDPQKWIIGYWTGAITFTPHSTYKAESWTFNFKISKISSMIESQGRPNYIGSNSNGLEFLISSWAKNPIPC